MGSYTYQQDGREAFERGADCIPPVDLMKSQAKHWKRGWREAHNEAELREEKEQWEAEFGQFCPWREGSACCATDLDCEEENCAVNYFLDRRT